MPIDPELIFSTRTYTPEYAIVLGYGHKNYAPHQGTVRFFSKEASAIEGNCR
jgi:hypothetical protein